MPNTNNPSQADIRILGVGGGGGNALETMIKEGIQGVQFIAVNTDGQALENSSAEHKIQLGAKLTKGLGAGADPEIGRRAGIESYEEIVKALKGADMVFVTAGMGGGTGTGAAPLVAQAADELGLLTVGIVTKPFLFEGPKRMKQAEKGIRELRNYVDTLIVAPNEKLLHISQKTAPLLELFKVTDDVLLNAVKGIAELVSVPGLVNLDFADIRTVMMDKGLAIMGRGVAEGVDRSEKAVRAAVSSPLLSGMSIQGATGMIVNITANSSLSLMEVQSASSVLTAMADGEADIVIGAVIDETMKEKLSVTVIATGFEGKQNSVSVPQFVSHSSTLQPKENPSIFVAQTSIEKSPIEEEQKSKPVSPFPATHLSMNFPKNSQNLSKQWTYEKARPPSSSENPSNELFKQAKPSVVQKEGESHSIKKSYDPLYNNFPSDSSQGVLKEEDTFTIEKENQESRTPHFSTEHLMTEKENPTDFEDTKKAIDSLSKSTLLLKEQEETTSFENQSDKEETPPSLNTEDPDSLQLAGGDSLKMSSDPSFDNKIEALSSFENNQSNKEENLTTPSLTSVEVEKSHKDSVENNSFLNNNDKQELDLDEKQNSPREILLQKIKDYAQNQKKDNKHPKDNQLSMDWRESPFHQEPSSPFESALEFSDEEMGLK